jgi:hypothetical protein
MAADAIDGEEQVRVLGRRTHRPLRLHRSPRFRAGPCLGPYGGPRGGGRFLMSEVPMYCINSGATHRPLRLHLPPRFRAGPLPGSIDFCLTQL